MPRLLHPPHSWRDDPAVPGFPDDQPLFVFDGVCVLCSGGAGWLMRRNADIRFAASQSRLGQALHAHFGVDFDDSYLLLLNGHAYTQSTGYLVLFRHMGGLWRAMTVFALVPEGLRDHLYRWVARNRYRWFGTAEHCALLTPEQRASMVDV